MKTIMLTAFAALTILNLGGAPAHADEQSCKARATEKKLAELYDGHLGPFFLEVKNDHCVVCGKDHGLTRHHVVPKRHKRKLPLEVRKQLSNVLFVCLDCHDRYEARQLVSESLDPFVWKDHFVATMEPAFLPKGWDIVLAVR